MQRFKVNSQLVPKVEWKQTDRRMEAIALPPSLMLSVKYDVKNKTKQNLLEICNRTKSLSNAKMNRTVRY